MGSQTNSEILKRLVGDISQSEIDVVTLNPNLADVITDARSVYANLRRMDLDDVGRADWEATLKELQTEMLRGLARLRENTAGAHNMQPIAGTQIKELQTRRR